MNTLDAIVPALNAALRATPLSDFYARRRRLKHLSPQANRDGLLQVVHDGNEQLSGYAFHWGGRGELQFNVGFEDDRYFRYGVAFSFEPSQNHPDPTGALAPKVARFNAILNEFPVLQTLRMWSYDDVTRNEHRSVAPIPAALVKTGNFIFVGERVDALRGVTPQMVERAATVLASLLPLYESIESEAAPAKYKTARLCWNTDFWQRPTGANGKTSNTGAFENQHGFGHEEWLFDLSSPGTNAWKLGFLQALNHSHRRYAGQSLNLLLYTIDDKTRHRYWVASIKNAHVLDADEAAAARDLLRSNGTMAQMRAQVQSLGLDPASLDNEDPVEIVNLRYRPVDLIRFEPPVAFPAGKLPADYYGILQDAPESLESLLQDTGHDDAITERGIHVLSASRATAYAADATIDLVQKRWQKELRESLSALLPQAKIHIEAVMFRHAVDMIIEQGATRFFVELKTASSARQAIREALGQLLEYSCWPPAGPRADVLLIVAAGPSQHSDKEYLALLRDRYSIPVYYLQYRDGGIDGIVELVSGLAAHRAETRTDAAR